MPCDIVIKEITLESIKDFIKPSKKEGMAGYSINAIYYGAYTYEGILLGFTSIQYYTNKVKFNNHYIFKEFRGNGYFKCLLDFSIKIIKEKGFNTIIAACTKMSIKEYIKRGAIIEKEYKICTNVKLIV